jgi:hypothetical protein
VWFLAWFADAAVLPAAGEDRARQVTICALIFPRSLDLGHSPGPMAHRTLERYGFGLCSSQVPLVPASESGGVAPLRAVTGQIDRYSGR